MNARNEIINAVRMRIVDMLDEGLSGDDCCEILGDYVSELFNCETLYSADIFGDSEVVGTYDDMVEWVKYIITNDPAWAAEYVISADDYSFYIDDNGRIINKCEVEFLAEDGLIYEVREGLDAMANLLVNRWIADDYGIYRVHNMRELGNIVFENEDCLELPETN